MPPLSHPDLSVHGHQPRRNAQPSHASSTARAAPQDSGVSPGTRTFSRAWPPLVVGPRHSRNGLPPSRLPSSPSTPSPGWTEGRLRGRADAPRGERRQAAASWPRITVTYDTCGALFVRALGGIRTPNLLIRSQMLYPLSYQRGVTCALISTFARIFSPRTYFDPQYTRPLFQVNTQLSLVADDVTASDSTRPQRGAHSCSPLEPPTASEAGCHCAEVGGVAPCMDTGGLRKPHPQLHRGTVPLDEPGLRPTSPAQVCKVVGRTRTRSATRKSIRHRNLARGPERFGPASRGRGQGSNVYSKSAGRGVFRPTP